MTAGSCEVPTLPAPGGMHRVLHAPRCTASAVATLRPVFCAMLLLAAHTAEAGHAQSALDSAGTGARHTEHLWWQMTATMAVVYLLVLAALFAALLRRRGAPSERPRSPESARSEHAPYSQARSSEHRLRAVVLACSGATAFVLAVFLFVSHSVGNEILELAKSTDQLPIKVTGHMWWWEIEYPDPVASRTVVTANEIHLPVGRTARLQLVAADVIHSFWAPSLSGKLDLIPGRDNELWIKAEREGTYFGQCAEFCGLQHAHMRFIVVAEPEAAFQAWLEAQRQPAAAPTGGVEEHGQSLFLSGPCAMCHTVRGTDAASRAGPDLTHLASRRMLAGASFPIDRTHLEIWVTDSQSMKPGNNMPPLPFAKPDLDAVVAWLETLR